MGRKKYIEKDPGFLSRLVETYTLTGSEVETARKLSCGERTVRKYLHEAGIHPSPGRPKGRYHDKNYKGAFPRWLRDHPEITLPESPKEIAVLTGCTTDEISSHLRRLRKAIEREINSLPDLRTLDVVMPDEEGKTIPMKAIASYKILIRKHSRKIRIQATLKGGKDVSFYTHLDYIWEVIPKGYHKGAVTASQRHTLQ